MPEIATASVPERVQRNGGHVDIDARGMYYRDLNQLIRASVDDGVERVTIHNVFGQRYIGTNLQRSVKIDIEGVPGNDMGAFMDGPKIVVHGNAQDGCGNTMNQGMLVVHGSAGDIAGHSMRGGRIFVRDNVGYRVGIHMKEFGETKPVIVIGGTAQHFLGEYMAGGILIVLGRQLEAGAAHPSKFIGTGMHGGVIYIRGRYNNEFLGKEVGTSALDDEDELVIQRYVRQYGELFGIDIADVLSGPFTKLYPKTKRPYGRLYAY